MIFLLDYDRKQGQLIAIRSFDDSDRELAENARLELELSQHRKHIDREVVLLEAADLEALKRTHRRYFDDLAALARPAAD